MSYQDKKNWLRMNRLMEYTRKNGPYAGEQKAERDAGKIETLSKCRERAQILESNGFVRLAHPFRSREKWLIAQGITE